MMAYADYEFYADVYYGNAIAEEDFPRLAERATDYIFGITSGESDRLTGNDKIQLQKATCAIAEVFQDESRMNTAEFSTEQCVSSETVGGHSVSYGTGGVSGAAIEYIESRKKEVLKIYLGHLFRVKSYSCACRGGVL